MNLDVFGRILEVVRENEQWVIYHVGEGKKTHLKDILIPSDYSEDQAIEFLEDMLHEAATPQIHKIKRLD